MNPALSACFATLAQAFLSCASANAADVMPVWQNDTVANTISFNDTFGHQVSIGSYNPSTGAFSVGSGGPGSFTTISASGAVSGAGFTALFASPPPIGSTTPNTGAFTTLTASGGATFSGAGISLTSINNAYVQGLLVVQPNAMDASLTLVKPASGNNSLIQSHNGANGRWQIDLGDAATESGSNVGSDFNINSYSDAGAFLGKWETITRANGLMTYRGSISHSPATAMANGVVPGILQSYAMTGSTGAATSSVINTISVPTDNLTMTGSASAFLWAVQDFSFGGAAASGGRIMSYSAFTQTAASESTHTFRSYVGNQAAINTTSGDGGGSGTEKGDYYGYWSTNILGASAVHVNSMQGLEIDLTAASGSSLKYKSAILIGSASLGSADTAQGSVVDTYIWMSGCPTCVGVNVGIQFGRPDGFGTLGIKSTGTLMATAVEAGTIATGIDLTGGGNTTISNNAWVSPGASITGTGLFASTGTSSTGFQSTGTKTTAGFYEASTTPYGMQLIGTYSTASWYATTKPDFHYAPTISTCAQVGQLPIFINGVAKNLMYC